MKKYKIDITRDENAWNPREDDNVTTMVCFHKRYNLGDTHNVTSDSYNGWDEMEEAVIKDYDVLAIAPLFMYEHSGITISTSPFGCNFDSGRLGFVMITEEDLKKTYGHTDFTQEQLHEIIAGEVKTYDSYLRGDVYEYSISEVQTCNLGCEHENIIESCGGYYSEEDAKAEAEKIVEYYKLGTAVAYHG